MCMQEVSWGLFLRSTPLKCNSSRTEHRYSKSNHWCNSSGSISQSHRAVWHWIGTVELSWLGKGARPLCLLSSLLLLSSHWICSHLGVWAWAMRLFVYCPAPKLCQTLCEPMDCTMPGFPVLHCLPEFAQTHVHWVSDAIPLSHPLLPPSPPALNLSQYQCLF